MTDRGVESRTQERMRHDVPARRHARRLELEVPTRRKNLTVSVRNVYVQPGERLAALDESGVEGERLSSSDWRMRDALA